MSNSAMKVVKDSKKILAEKEQRKHVDNAIKNSEDKDRIIKKWDDHIKSGDKLKNFTSIVNNQMYFSEAPKNHTFIPFSEYYGSYQLNWIINWDEIEKREVWRKNILYVDLIEWGLPPVKS